MACYCCLYIQFAWWLTNGAIAIDSPMSASDVEGLLASNSTIADIDGNGIVDALTDGLLLLRYLFGLFGNDLINGAKL